jgi:TPR repeat protein
MKRIDGDQTKKEDYFTLTNLEEHCVSADQEDTRLRFLQAPRVEIGTENADVGESPSRVHSWKIRADQGFANAQFNYGFCLMKGAGVCVDLGMAAHYFKLSADQGFANAQFRYGLCIMKGDGVCVDLGMAAHYFKLSADQGFA